MIINVYFTNGYIEWGKIFIKSYTYHNGTNDKMIVTTRNLNKKQIKILKGLRNNIEVRNKNLNLTKLAKKANIDVQKLRNYKNETEKVKVNQNNKVWKLMIAGDERIKSIYKLMCEMDEGKHLLHFDADTYIKNNVSKIKNIIKNNDFSTIFRIQKQIKRRGKVFREHRATLICVMGWTINKYSKEYMERWIHYIDKVPPKERKKGYGQTSSYYAYQDISKKYPNFKWGQLAGTRKLWMNSQKGSKINILGKAQKHFENLK